LSGLHSIPTLDSQPTPAEHRTRRLRRAGWSVLAGYAARAASIAASLASVPLLLSYFGAERYGLWLMLVSVTAALSVIDLGLGHGLQNRVAEARGRDEQHAAGELVSTAVAAMAAWSGVVAVVGVAVSRLAPVGQWLRVTSPQIENEFVGALIVVALTFVFVLPLKVIGAAQSGFQESFFGDLWGIGGSVMIVAAILIVLAVKGDMAVLALAAFLLAQPSSLLGIRHFFKRHPYAQLSWRKVRVRCLPSLFSLGWQFFLLQLAALTVWQTDSIIIATQKGGDAVVPYGVAFRLMGLPLSLLLSIPNALWPAYTEARARGDWEWMRSMYRRTTVVTMLIASLIAVCLFVWGQEFILVWAGPNARGSQWLMGGLCLYLVLGQWSNCNGVILNAISRPREQAFSALFEAALNVALSLYLIRIWGIAGVAWGTALASLLVSCWFLAWSVWRMTERRVAPPWREVVLLSAIPVAGSLLVGMGLIRLLPGEWPGLLRVGVGVTAMAASYGVSAYLFAPEEWRDVFRRFGGLAVNGY